MAQCRQPADDGVGHADAPDLVARILRQIAEGQHRHGPSRTGGLGAARVRSPQPQQVGAQVGSALIAQRAILFERFVDDAGEGQGHLAVQMRQRHGALAQNRGERVGRTPALEGCAPGGHLVEHGAEAEQIRTDIEWLGARLLGRHVRDRPHRHTRPRERVRLFRVRRGRRVRGRDGHRLRQPEIEQLRLPAIGDENVRGLDVTMHDPASVRGVQGVGDLQRVLDGRVQLDRSALEQLVEGHAFEILHDDERLAGVLVDVVDGADVRMVERRCGPCFALEPLERAGRSDVCGRQQLDRDGSQQLRVFRLEDHAHAARADLFEDPVVRDRLVDHRRRRGAGTGTAIAAAKGVKPFPPAVRYGCWPEVVGSARPTRCAVRASAGPTFCSLSTISSSPAKRSR